MKSKILNISIPQDLIDVVDKQAKKDYSSRSDYIRKALVNQTKTDQALASLFDSANKKGQKLGINSEEQVYKIIAGR